jgi:ATP/maltotriose-dependent transcriptional regulator MalT
VTTIWIVPSAAYVVSETSPEKCVELLGWVFTYQDLSLNWVRQWPLFERLQVQLQDKIGIDSYESHWEKGARLSPRAIEAYLSREFRASPDAGNRAAPDTVLTARESEILLLLANGLTNPQIAQRLVIGTGTVKTHTLSIYRKLDVANRTQAILRARQLGLLTDQTIE